MKKIILFNYLIFLIGSGIFANKANAQEKSKSKKVSAVKKYNWNGEWNFSSRYTPSKITIQSISSNRFKFTIGALDGANSGEISGIAKIKVSEAYFDNQNCGDY